jgi:hypothetical protein
VVSQPLTHAEAVVGAADRGYVSHMANALRKSG